MTNLHLGCRKVERGDLGMRQGCTVRNAMSIPYRHCIYIGVVVAMMFNYFTISLLCSYIKALDAVSSSVSPLHSRSIFNRHLFHSFAALLFPPLYGCPSFLIWYTVAENPDQSRCDKGTIPSDPLCTLPDRQTIPEHPMFCYYRFGRGCWPMSSGDLSISGSQSPQPIHPFFHVPPIQ